MKSSTQALIATARVSNLPSVLSNVLLGVLLGAALSTQEQRAVLPMEAVISALLVGCLVYVAGNFANDWMDREWDQRHRPERALPQGLFSPRRFLEIATSLCASAVMIAGVVHLPMLAVALMLIACMVAYTRWHKLTVHTCWLVGACRALLLLLGLIAVQPTALRDIVDVIAARGFAAPALIWTPLSLMLGMLCYIAGISLWARHESVSPDRRAGFGVWLLLLMPAMTHGWMFLSIVNWQQPLTLMPVLIGMLPFVGWTLHALLSMDLSLPERIARLLSGISLVDGILLNAVVVKMMLFDRQLELTGEHVGFLLLLCFPVVAWGFARLLQRHVPAT